MKLIRNYCFILQWNSAFPDTIFLKALLFIFQAKNDVPVLISVIMPFSFHPISVCKTDIWDCRYSFYTNASLT